MFHETFRLKKQLWENNIYRKRVLNFWDRTFIGSDLKDPKIVLKCEFESSCSVDYYVYFIYIYLYTHTGNTQRLNLAWWSFITEDETGGASIFYSSFILHFRGSTLYCNNFLKSNIIFSVNWYFSGHPLILFLLNPFYFL